MPRQGDGCSPEATALLARPTLHRSRGGERVQWVQGRLSDLWCLSAVLQTQVWVSKGAKGPPSHSGSLALGVVLSISLSH